MKHTEWLDNEYTQWIAALKESTVDNFKEHPMVKRMLSEPNLSVWEDEFITIGATTSISDAQALSCISDIGGASDNKRMLRFVYYARHILSHNPSSIVEVGAGVGQFYATLRAIGYKGFYMIEDLDGVAQFQYKYLNEVFNRTGLYTLQTRQTHYDYFLSFYALGEFDNETKQGYAGLISRCKHGYVAWNPHSGATDDLSIFPSHITVTPGIEPGIKIIEW
jgi:hypothetical protein